MKKTAGRKGSRGTDPGRTSISVRELRPAKAAALVQQLPRVEAHLLFLASVAATQSPQLPQVQEAVLRPRD